jgi:hypothetical protein
MPTHVLQKITSYIEQRKLTHLLDAFEELGYFGESALDLLRYLQWGGR